MKRIIFTMMMALICVISYGQRVYNYSIMGRAGVEGDMKALKSEKKIKLVIDYSEGYFNGFSEEKAKAELKNWQEDTSEAYSDAVKTLDRATGGKKMFGDIKEATLTLTIKIFKGTDDLDDLLADVILTNVEGNVLCKISDIQGDDMDELAKRIGRFMRAEIR
ncbi:MAG: hypothetical protein MJZ01_02820 [Bacteroidales bacterium]|nr:hypothetical protein [Bacteroidales bacterium]